jgi:hypothetical protein
MLSARQSAHGANKLSDLASPRRCSGRVSSVLVTLRTALQSAAVHPAAAFAIAACRHGCPVAGQWAPHLALGCIGNLPGIASILNFCMIPTLRRPDNADHRLAAGINMDMVYGHLLPVLAAMAVEASRSIA